MSARPVILLTNDDGMHSPILPKVQDCLQGIADIYTIVPDRNMSGCSHSISIKSPLFINKISDRFIAVEGTPADCVHLGLTSLLPKKPSLVVSGVNLGPNLGDDVLYSGTVAGAFEASKSGVPAIAISHASYDINHIETSLNYLYEIVANYHSYKIPLTTVLNVNCPNVPLSEVSGINISKLGFRQPSHDSTKQVTSRGRDIYWIGMPGDPVNNDDSSDFHAINNNYVSITPLHIDMTDHSNIDILKHNFKT
jgi:5'-nucleotidase